MDDNSVTITLSGKLSYKDQISLTQAAQIIAMIGSGEVAPGTFAAAPPKDSRVKGGGASPRESLEASGAKSNPEKVVAFALHVIRQGGKAAFTSDDVKPLFGRAGEPTPRNLSRDMRDAVRVGWIAESDTNTGEYYVTDKARDVLETGFDQLRGVRRSSSKPAPRGRASSNKTTRKTSDAIPTAFEDIEIIHPTIDGMVGYHKLKTNTDRFLWAVYAAKLLGVGTLDNHHVVWLTDRLGVGIPSKDVSPYYKRLHQRGHLNRTTKDDRIRITPAGEEYLKALPIGGKE